MTTDTDTAEALEAAIDAHGANASGARAALHRAIAAHVEAEVARRLAAAPDVEVAIVDYALAAQGDFDTSEERDALRAAIAADKARAVANARRIGFKAGSAERSSVHDAIGVSPQEAARAAMAHGVPCPTCGSEARPTPDEALRLVDALEEAAQRRWMCNDEDGPAAVALLRRLAADCDDARTALLRVLGVEA